MTSRWRRLQKLRSSHAMQANAEMATWESLQSSSSKRRARRLISPDEEMSKGLEEKVKNPDNHQQPDKEDNGYYPPKCLEHQRLLRLPKRLTLRAAPVDGSPFITKPRACRHEICLNTGSEAT